MIGGSEEVPGTERTREQTLEAAVAERDAKLAAQDAKLAAQEAKLAERDAKLAAQEAKLAGQGAKLSELAAQVEKLTEQLGRNSSNSHLPPSSDGPGSGSRGGAVGKPKPKSGRKRGGQKGHRGSHRALFSEARVDSVVNLYPSVCLGCGHTLEEELDAAPYRYQQLELRDHRPHVTEWRCHEVDCERCGAATRAEYDRTKIPRSAFGPCLTAVVALLTGAYHLSRRKTQRLLSELLGISISLGAISAMERRSSEALKACHEEALLEVQHADVKHTDATSWARSGTLTSLWVVATSLVTVY